jgi:DNA-binding IclR family transcriptional regulator
MSKDVRCELLEFLARQRGWLDTGAIITRTGLSAPNVRRHLADLADEGILDRRSSPEAERALEWRLGGLTDDRVAP